ncbi:hypothetical protein BJ875DRAFT_254238 [Amylocarpus encephaloides]|uniref:Uncharacterized protein n=1 Tax=Amylocarpus encephaloides TaxID=45428 RepID=A0A9P8C718_9HELO|nr:hypothetical protein BJ875DRAFT_254238 [Amylocarpus encephaloides]
MTIPWLVRKFMKLLQRPGMVTAPVAPCWAMSAKEPSQLSAYGLAHGFIWFILQWNRGIFPCVCMGHRPAFMCVYTVPPPSRHSINHSFLHSFSSATV